MSAGKRAHENGVWKYSYGTRPHVVFAMERRDRGGQVFVRFSNLGKAGAEKRERKRLGLVVRDARTGRLDRKLVRAAELAVQHFQARLLVGQSTACADAEPPPNAARLPKSTPAPAQMSLTIRAGFDLVLDPERGKYGSNRTRRYDQMRKYRERLFGGPRRAAPLLDRTLAWTAFVPAEARALWRRMADRHVSSEGEEFGVRAAEGILDAIYSVAAWLREEHVIPPDSARAPAQWRKALKEEWSQRTGKPRTRPHRPRHTAAEYRRIFAAIYDPRVDPRIRLAIELAAECRTGQALRCTRRMLLLPDMAPKEYESTPRLLGQIEIPGAGKKHGEVVFLTPEQRRSVDDAIAGYLANYEAAWRAGQIEDYYLFPGSKMRLLDSSGRRSARKVRPDVKPLTRDGARVAFKQLEAIAGVEHVEGRGWYGLRRIAADLAESATTDDRVKDRLGGWQDSETRKQIYQDRLTDELRMEAAKVRRELRLGAKPVTHETQPSFDVDAHLAALTAEQRALLAAKTSCGISIEARFTPTCRLSVRLRIYRPEAE